MNTMNTPPDSAVKLAVCLCEHGKPEQSDYQNGFNVECSDCCAQTPLLNSQSLADAAWNRMMGETAPMDHSEAWLKQFLTSPEYQLCESSKARTLLSALADELDRRSLLARKSGLCPDSEIVLLETANACRYVLAGKE